VLSVGATAHGSGADGIAYFSSRGPTDDGRIKPSITIVGSNVMSANNDGNISSNNCNDRSMSGTSMAAPGAAGLAALVRQYFSDGCTTDDTAFVEITRATGLVYGDTLLIAVEITNDEIFPLSNITTLSIPATETDNTLTPVRTFDFEADYDGWSVSSGTFVRATILGAASGSWYLQSSAGLSSQCDVVESPALELTPTSTLSIFTHYEIEGGTPWYDRANLAIVDGAARTVVEADGGRLYDVPSGSPNGTCGTTNQAGWAGTNTTWAVSTYSASALGASSFAGRPVGFELRYGTDSGIHLGGFRFDRIEVTDVIQTTPDVQSDTCSLIFADGFESGDTSAWLKTLSNLME
jgi:hypothetical protein